jgi:hypothetical protein
VDEWLGVEGSLSVQAERLVALAAASWSFDRAAALLEEFCGLQVTDDTIRRHSLETGRRLREWQREAPEVRTRFAQAAGAVEFSTDGTSVNTLQGWREMRLAVFAKRAAGTAATPDQWDERELPAPTARVLFGGLWSAEQYGPQWRAWASRLGITQTQEITVLADGARWIWKQVEQHLPAAAGVLDIYHASEHLFGTARVLFGEGAREGAAWVDERRRELLEGGAARLLGSLRQESPGPDPGAGRESLKQLQAYFAPHQAHTCYRERLAAGRSIGSGMIEGACKTVVGRRLKQTGARWRVRHAERVVALCGGLYSDLWDTYWETRGN